MPGHKEDPPEKEFPDSTSTYVSPKGWSIRVTGIGQERIDRKSMAYAMVQLASQQVLSEARKELTNLKGDRSKQATRRRKQLRSRIAYLERLLGTTTTGKGLQSVSSSR
jgi:hypothetical protein